MERYDEALADFNRAVDLAPEYNEAIAERGMTYRLMGHYDEALIDFERAIDLDPEDDLAITRRGATYRLMGRNDEALADFNRAIELDPEYTWAIASRGETYQAMGRYEEALADFSRAIELDLEDDWSFYQRSIIRRAIDPAGPWCEDLDRAAVIGEEVYRVHPSDLDNLLNLALYRMVQGYADRAEALCLEALERGKADPALREALRDLDDYLHLFPDDTAAARLRERLADSAPDEPDA